MSDIELKSQSVVGSRRVGDSHHVSNDDVQLARSGKKAVLKRRFGLLSILGFSCGLMCTWEGMLVAFLLGLQNGGPGGLIYGFIVVWLGNISVFITMGELASMIPTASGQYHWVNILAPERLKRSLSYTIGWVTVAGWVAGTTATAFFVSSIIQALIQLNNPEYTAPGWQGTLLLWAVLVICVFINTVLSRALPAIEIGILILHVIGFFAIIVPLIYLSPVKSSASDIFTTFENAGGWSTQALSFFIGLNGNAVAFVGSDGAIHMSEEVKDASRNVPKAILISIIVNGVFAFGMLLTALFCMGDIDSAVANAPNGYPFIAIFAQNVGSNSGATGMTFIILILELCSCIAGLAAASRMIWSFARDRGLPGHLSLSKVERRTTIPLAAVIVVFVVAALIGLINIGNTTAFNAVVSLVLEAFYTSYLIPCGLLLYRRLRGDIRDYETNEPKPYEWGPWRLNGMFGTINNVVACAYLILIAFFSYWPTNLPVTPANMNYSCLVLGVVALFSAAYYFLVARRSYTGPVVEVQVGET